MKVVFSGYKELKVWQRSFQLGLEVYKLTHGFPSHELYGLTSQIRRSSISVASNIAEGHSRDSLKDYLRFISIAYGSLAEVETQLLFAEALGYIKDKHDVQPLIKEISEIGRMLNGLRNTLKTKLVA